MPDWSGSTDEAGGRDFIFIIDRSGSMGRAPAGSPSKLDLAREAIKRLIQQLAPDQAVALAAFAETHRILHPLGPRGENQQWFQALDELTTGGGTRASAVLTALRRILAVVRQPLVWPRWPPVQQVRNRVSSPAPC